MLPTIAPQPLITTLEVVKILDKPLFQKHLKCLIKLAHPERLELPTTWLEARYPTVVVSPLNATFIADYCTTFLQYYFSVWACFALYWRDSLIFIGDFQRRYFR